MAWSFTLYGPPRTKNAHTPIMVKGKRVLLPPKLYREWFAAAKLQVNRIKVELGLHAPIEQQVNVAAVFFRKRAAGDLDNYFKALGDLLQRAGVLKNDALIRSWDGSAADKDAKRPRIEVVITLAGAA